MTVRDFALAAFEPEGMEVAMCGATYDLMNNYNEKLDPLMLELFGDYVVQDFISNEPRKYTVSVKEAPVKAVTA